MLSLTPRMIMHNKGYVQWFIDYHMERLPDISDLPDIGDSTLQLWRKKRPATKTSKPKKDRKKPHKVLTALCGKWANAAVDFAIEHNKWAVRSVNTEAQI